MTGLPRVTGISFVSSDHWPLIALSASHALKHHVDHLVLLHHSDGDDQNHRLEMLQELWPDRLHVVESTMEQFFQEAATNLLVQVSQKYSPDWIYVFDADEFMITTGRSTLPEILANIGPAFSHVRYQLQNWVTPFDFHAGTLEDIRRVNRRSRVNQFMKLPVELYADEIAAGNLNYFDLPFRSKVIIRNSEHAWLAAGSHSLHGSRPGRSFELPLETARAAHLPLLSRDRLDAKVKHGETLVRSGFPLRHGWQSQMIFRLADQGLLDRFWATHSDGGPEDGSQWVKPTTVEDDSFVRVMTSTIELLDRNPALYGTAPETATNVLPAGNDLIHLDDAIKTVRRIQLEVEALRSEKELISAERDRIAIERDNLRESRAWRYSQAARRLGRRFGKTG